MQQHMSEYFAKVLPWPQEGDRPAYINIHWMIDKLSQKTGKNIWTGRAVQSVQQAVRTVEWVKTLADSRDIYVCMSSQQDALPRQSKAGRTYLTPIRSQANAVMLKSFFIDLDAKGSDKNSYASIKEAAAALAAFLLATGLPKPNVIVQSGGGLHVYWTLDKAIPVFQWQPLATALAEATKAHGLKCDTGCTIDAARILRVPFTFNRKLATPRSVQLAGGRTGGDYSLARLEKSLAPYVGIARTPQAGTPTASIWSVLPRKVPLTGPSDLELGVETNYAPVDLNAVAKECSFIADAISTGGAAFANPLWNLTTLIATFAGGRPEAHRMALGHPSYTQGGTDELFDRKQAERTAKGLGWPACRTISASGHAGCQTCPHFAANKSPLNFAATQLVAAVPASPQNGGATVAIGNPVNGDIPVGWKRLPSNIICQILVQEDGSHRDQPICNYPMFTPSIQTHPTYALNFSTIADSGRTSHVTIPTVEMSSKDSLRKAMLRHGMALKENESKGVMEFFMSWIEKLQKQKEMVVSSSPYGWSTNSKGDVEGFVYGGEMWMSNGSRSAATPDPVLARRYNPQGNKSSWIAAAKMITDQKRPALDAIIASSFAAPLIRFTHESGILMSVYSEETAIGKTTALRVAQSVWGHPKRAMQGLDDTSNFIFNKVGQLQHLPMYWDELKTDEDTKRFVKIAFNLTKMKEKDRMTQSAVMRDSGSWETLLVSASNDSIMDHVVAQSKQTTAGMYRVFEYKVWPAQTSLGQIDQADASRITGKLDDNYGEVGLEYAKYLGSNHEAIAKDVEEFYKAVGNEIATSNEERFWRVMLACLLKGAEYSNKLGLTHIDGFALKKFLFHVINDLRNDRTTQPVDLADAFNVSSVLAQFLNAQRARHTLRTNRIHMGRGKPAAGSIILKTLYPDRLDAIYVHVGTDDKMLRISRTYIQNWLNDNGYSAPAILRAMVNEFKAVTIQGRIASGTEFAGSGEWLLEIDMNKNPSTNFVDEA